MRVRGRVVGTAPEQSLWDPTDCHTPKVLGRVCLLVGGKVCKG